MKKIIAAGHICLDITPVFPASGPYAAVGELLEPGKLIHMHGAEVSTGGSVANTGLALKYLGADVTLMGKIGADAFGGMVTQSLAAHGVGGLLTDPASATSYSVVLAVPGVDRIFLHDPGANDSFAEADIPDAALTDAALFHFGYPPLMKRMYENGGAELTALFRRVKAHGVATSLDMAAVDPHSPAGQADWETLLQNTLPYVDFFVPSFEELCFMLDRPRYERLARHGGDMTARLDLEAEAMPLAEKAVALGAKTVLLKCGTSGMVYRTTPADALAGTGLDPTVWADRRGLQPCFRADTVRSATGAGDAGIAAFLMAVLAGKDPADCAALAAAEGACAVTAYDALGGLKPLDELEKRIKAGWETM